MNHQGDLSRRGFMKVAGAATAALAVSSLAAGCAAQPKSSSSQAKAALDESSIAWTDEADVVIMGLGAAGAAALVEACAADLKVIVFEKDVKAGGATVLSGGLIYLGGGTALQKRLGVNDTPENFKSYLTKAVGPSADPDLLNTFCEMSPDMFDWCVEHGMKFDGDVDLTSHVVEPPEGISLMFSGTERVPEFAKIADPAPRAHAPEGGSINIIEPLVAEAEGKADIRYSTSVTELIADASGAVIGVRAESDDKKELIVKANKGVIIASGAFTLNDELVGDCRPEALACKKRTGSQYDNGDGIVAAVNIGAATRSLSRVTVGAHVYLYGALSAGALLDHTGHRFLGEDWYGSFVGRKVMENTPDTCYMIVDQSVYDQIMETPYAKGLPEAVKADTIEEIADQTGLPVENVTFSIDRYNELCAGGVDLDYGKGSEFLVPIATAPYYAISIALGSFASFFTLGGLKINTSAQVLGHDGKTIPGLYAAGRSSCGIFGEYAGSGSSIADGLTFGRIAGKAVAEQK